MTCLIPYNEWLEQIFEHLNCNASTEFKECFETFDYSDDDIMNNLELFNIWFERGLRPIEALKRFERYS